MSRIDRYLLAPLFLGLLACPCFADGLVETQRESGFGDQGTYQGRSLRLVQESGAYVGGTLGDWRSDPQTVSRITGIFLGYKTTGPIALDVALGSYSELDPRRPHPLGEMLPRDLGSMGRLAVGLHMKRNLHLSVGGLYLRANNTSELSRRSDRVVGQARLDYRFF